MIGFEPGVSPEENDESMTEAMGDVLSGQVTFAVRDTVIEDKEISEGDILGIAEGKICAVEPNVEDSVRTLFDNLIDEDSELVTIYYGHDVDEATAQQVAEDVEERYEDCEVEVHYGGQPLYYYIVSVE